MTGVRFYIVPETEWLDAARFAARLTRFLRAKGRTVLITPPAGQETELTELLWRYPADAFLPVENGSGITVGSPATKTDEFDVLINLTPDILDGHARFTDLCEVVPSSDTALEQARDRWRHYKDRGHPLKRIETENI